jgi:hypothetical protein
MRYWMSGMDIRSLAEDPPSPLPKDGPLRRDSSIERLMDLNNYLSRMPAFLAWMYSGVVRVADYLVEEEEVEFADEIRLGIEYLRLGVSSPAARFLVDSVGLPRTVAKLLSEELAFDPENLEPTLLQSLFDNGLAAVRDAPLDEWTRREAGRAIRDLDPASMEQT